MALCTGPANLAWPVSATWINCRRPALCSSLRRLRLLMAPVARCGCWRWFQVEPMAVELGESKKISVSTVALVLWVVTVVLATWNFLVIRDMVLRMYARLFPSDTLQNQGVFTLLHTVLVIL